jgi:hypothetical protein
MDYEMFECDTVWLADPIVVVSHVTSTGDEVQQRIPVQKYEAPDQLVDADVCWDSRDVPLPQDGKLVDFGGYFNRDIDKNNGASEVECQRGADYPPPKGREHWKDLEWSRFCINSGRL